MARPRTPSFKFNPQDNPTVNETTQKTTAPAVIEPQTVVEAAPPEPVQNDMSDTLHHDWYEFVRHIQPDAPYELLNQLPFHKGFVYKVEEDHTDVLDQTIVVHFRIMIGRTMDNLRYLDQFTIQVPRNTVAPSVAARSIMGPSVIYTIFGRLPPEAPPAPAPAPARAAAPAPAPVTAAPAPEVAAPKPAPRPEPVEDDMPEWQETARPPVRIRATRTPDGVPMFEDPYEKDGRPEDLAAALLERFEDCMDEIDSATKLKVLWRENAQAVEFIKDFGGENGRERLASIFRNKSETLNRN